MIVNMRENMQFENKIYLYTICIYLTLYYLIKKLQRILPTRAPNGIIEESIAFVVTIFPV